MPVKRISEQNWQRLKQWAEPLDDDVDDVLGRLLDLADEHGNSPDQLPLNSGKASANGTGQLKRRQNGKRTPVDAFNYPIGQTLLEMGRKGRVNKVLPVVERKMKQLLGEIDYQRLKYGQIRWQNTAQYARKNLVLGGFLRNDSPRGVWELTEEGVKAVNEETI